MPTGRQSGRSSLPSIGRSLPNGCARRSRTTSRALCDGIDIIPAYSARRGGVFRVAELGGAVVGTFGLERRDSQAAELRRMHVALGQRRLGIGRAMLHAAEREARCMAATSLVLSTSELQPEALAFHEAEGDRLARVEVANEGSGKTVGAGLRRFHLDTPLGHPASPSSPAAPVLD